LVRNYEHYILSSPIALGVYLSNCTQIFKLSDLLAVPLNIYNWLAGVGRISKILWTQPFVDISKTVTANVGTMFGTLYLAVGYWGSVFLSPIIGIFSYTFYLLVVKSQKVGLILLSSWILSVLSLSFFGIQFHLLAVWEVAFYSLLIPILCFFLGEVFPKHKGGLNESLPVVRRK